jgi:hypothetical protein
MNASQRDEQTGKYNTVTGGWPFRRLAIRGGAAKANRFGNNSCRLLLQTPLPLHQHRINNIRTVYLQVTQGYLEKPVCTAKVTLAGGKGQHFISK